MDKVKDVPKGTFIIILVDQTWCKKGKWIRITRPMRFLDECAEVKHAGKKRQVPEEELAIMWNKKERE